MKPFLRQVANIYATHETDNLMDYCFVFPNKRSATFFKHFLQQELNGSNIFPEITTISQFVADFSPLVEANRYEQLFTLFGEYRKLPGVDVDFDRFLFWGEMLISDFNDVDRYLVDAKTLFVNLIRLREISSNYLTPEQIEIINRYWGEQRPHDYVDRFWSHIDHTGDNPHHQKFIKLWEVLQPLYKSYRSRLTSEGLATQGMFYRNAVDALSIDSDYELPYTRYIFTGFNVLSTSELKIFSRLKRMGRADFYWDFNSPAFTKSDNKAGRFIRNNIREFPSIYSLEEDAINTLPRIDILGVPSNTGQVKAAGNVIQSWCNEGIITDAHNAIDTAVVLPDESLFIPMIHSMPDVITSMNVTMGFPMRLSPIAALMRNIISLQLRARKRDGETIYFHDDVKTLLTAPIIKNYDTDGCANISSEIQKRRLFFIPSTTIVGFTERLSPIFKPIADIDNINSIHEYVETLCHFLLGIIPNDDRLQRHFIESYLNAVTSLFEAASRFHVDMSGTSFFKLIERAINSDTVSFTGEPLAGLQIMGVLETRALDFKNIIMLSMNERIFPRKHYTRSFIPDALRRGYGMATLDFQESIFAYYFYRLISRAENVTLVYDARSVGGSKSSEISRYLAQLLYLFPDSPVSHKLAVYNPQHFDTPGISITKDNRILDLLQKFTRTDGANLSASAINSYINCPLSFYLQYVEGYNVDDEITDYMDSSTYGTILHEVAQDFYQGFQNGNTDAGVTITKDLLEPYLKPTHTLIDNLITRSINRHYNRFTDERLHTPLVGESLVLGKVIKESILSMLRCDITLTPFIYIGAEKNMSGRLKISDNLTVNVRQIIDRIDIVNGCKRFVDYKTGGDALSATSVEALFNTAQPNRAKAIMQLMLYCHIYRVLEQSDEPITPVIYKMRDLPAKGIEPLKISRTPISDYHQFYDEFLEKLHLKIEEIFDPGTPFTQSPDDHACTFCKFKAICGREDS